MEDSSQTPLLHESANVAVADDVHSTGIPSPVAEDSGDDEILHDLAEFLNELTIDDFCGGVPASFYPDFGSRPHQRLTMQEWLDAPLDDDMAALESDGEDFPPILPQTKRSSMYRQPVSTPNPDDPCLWIGRNSMICFALVTLLWSIVCITMVFGVHEIGTIQIGVGCSLLLLPNRFFTESISVEQPSGSNVGPMLYGFNNQPPLDVVTTWTDAHYAFLKPKIHKELIYFLNNGTEVNISYSIPSSSTLLLTISRGSDGYGQSLYDRSFPNTTLSWNVIHGNGLLQLNILQSGRYRIAVGNLNSEVEEVQLNISARAFIYNLSDAYYMCTLARGRCAIPLVLLEANHAVLTTPLLKQGTFDGQWHVKLAYGPRWTTYFGGIVVINAVILVVILFWNKYGHTCTQIVSLGSSRAPLLQHMDDDQLSSGTSYEYVPGDGDDLIDEIQPGGGESSNDEQHLCAVCFNVPRDSLFLPCRHSMACYACGIRIATTTGTCPVCQRRFKIVKKVLRTTR